MSKMSAADSFSSLYTAQTSFQKLVMKFEKEPFYSLPKDLIKWFEYHVTAMVEELGEVLRADKRWKTHRNTHYDRENKLEEVSDVFITAMNIGIYSGFSAEELEQRIAIKIFENKKKLMAQMEEQEAMNNDSHC